MAVDSKSYKSVAVDIVRLVIVRDVSGANGVIAEGFNAVLGLPINLYLSVAPVDNAKAKQESVLEVYQRGGISLYCSRVLVGDVVDVGKIEEEYGVAHLDGRADVACCSVESCGLHLLVGRREVDHLGYELKGRGVDAVKAGVGLSRCGCDGKSFVIAVAYAVGIVIFGGIGCGHNSKNSLVLVHAVLVFNVTADGDNTLLGQLSVANLEAGDICHCVADGRAALFGHLRPNACKIDSVLCDVGVGAVGEERLFAKAFKRFTVADGHVCIAKTGSVFGDENVVLCKCLKVAVDVGNAGQVVFLVREVDFFFDAKIFLVYGLTAHDQKLAVNKASGKIVSGHGEASAPLDVFGHRNVVVDYFRVEQGIRLRIKRGDDGQGLCIG